MQFKFKITAMSLLALLALLAVIAWTAACHWHRMNEKYYEFKYRIYDKNSFPRCNHVNFGEKIKRTDFLNHIGVWAKIVDVYDGDTFFAIFEMPHQPICMHKIRLKKVDTPELNSNNPNKQIKSHQCKNMMKAMLLDKIVQLRLVGTDHFGRMIADVSINGMDVVEPLLQTKCAKILPYWLWRGSPQ
jgi:endonuclease YncB( thermonuclease family)